jgi:hypothetical protein
MKAIWLSPDGRVRDICKGWTKHATLNASRDDPHTADRRHDVDTSHREPNIDDHRNNGPRASRSQ